MTTSDQIAAAAKAVIEPLSNDARLSAYYYSFEPTGVGAIDAILSAVAHAGKAYHNTEDWTEPWYRTLPNGGATAEEGIQSAANAAARAIEALVDEIEADR